MPRTEAGLGSTVAAELHPVPRTARQRHGRQSGEVRAVVDAYPAHGVVCGGHDCTHGAVVPNGNAARNQRSSAASNRSESACKVLDQLSTSSASF